MDTLLHTLIVAPPLAVAIIIHEVAHGLMAERLGDPTARERGRITLNPIRHIDPFMSIIVPALLIMAGSPIVFGGAKPVPVDPRYFANPRRDMSIVAIAGPLSNIVLAAGSYAILMACVSLSPDRFLESAAGGYAVNVLAFSILINVMLCCFNLLPIPPLDGGRIAVGILPQRLAYALARLERFGLVIVVALIYFGVIGGILGPIAEATLRFLQ